jgi:hypothetical protein
VTRGDEEVNKPLAKGTKRSKTKSHKPKLQKKS